MFPFVGALTADQQFITVPRRIQIAAFIDYGCPCPNALPGEQWGDVSVEEATFDAEILDCFSGAIAAFFHHCLPSKNPAWSRAGYSGCALSRRTA